MKRALLAIVVVLALAVAGVFVWQWTHPAAPEVQGSSTVEFVTTEPPAKPRPPKAVAAQPWPTYGYDAARTRDAAQFKVRPPYRRLWSVGAGGLLEFPPVVANGRVFVSQERGRVFAINAKNGNVLWGHQFHHCAASSPTVSKTVVYVTLMQPWPCARGDRSQRGAVVAIRVGDGKILWQHTTGVVESSPLLVGNLLYYGSWDRRLYALDVRTRKVRWSFEADDELNSSPAFSHGTVFIGSDGGSVYAVSAWTGELRWRARSYDHFPHGREYFYATPAVAYGRVYIGNTDGTMYAFGAKTGHLLWAKHAGTYVYTGAAVWRRTVYVGSYDGTMYAFDAATGDVRWTYAARSSIHGAPSIVDGLLYFATCGSCGHNGSRYAKRGPRGTVALDARTGKRVWSFRDGQYSPVVADSKRLYLTGRGRVYGLMPRHPAEPAPQKRARPRSPSPSTAKQGTTSGTPGR